MERVVTSEVVTSPSLLQARLRSLPDVLCCSEVQTGGLGGHAARPELLLCVKTRAL